MLAAPAPVRPGEHAGHVVLEELQVRPVAPRQAPHRAAPQLSDVLLQQQSRSQCYNHGPASAAVTCSTAVEPPPVVGFMVLWPPTTWPSPVRSSTRSSSALQPITAQLSPLSTNQSSALTALHQSQLSSHRSPPIRAQYSPLSTNQSSPVLQVHDVGEVGEAGAAVPRVHRPVRVLHTSPGGV